MAIPKFSPDYPIFVANTRPPEHLAHVKGAGRLVCLGISTGEPNNPERHWATALSHSDDAALVILVLALLKEAHREPLTIYTTNSDIHKQLANARSAAPAVRIRRRSFYEMEHFLKLADAVDEGRVRIVVLDDNTRNDDRFRLAYDAAHKEAREDASLHTMLTPAAEWGVKPCVLLSFDGALLR